MDAHMLNTIANFIWGIADDCLRDVYVRGKYRDVILPMTVIRRLDAVLEDSKSKVLEMKKTLDSAGITNQWGALCNAANQAFCNASPFCLRDLTSRPTAQKLKADFEAYLDGFSPNVQEILEKFKFRNQIDTMIEADILGAVIQKFVSKDINLSPKPTANQPGLDNHAMGTLFEELVRRFNEANNEEAGEHWTPRDVVELMADLVFAPIADQIKDATYSCYEKTLSTLIQRPVSFESGLNWFQPNKAFESGFTFPSKSILSRILPQDAIFVPVCSYESNSASDKSAGVIVYSVEHAWEKGLEVINIV